VDEPIDLAAVEFGTISPLTVTSFKEAVLFELMF
jgi:hypothetical protein